MTPPNPWAWLRSHPDIDLVWGGLPTGWRGATDGRTIWLAEGLTQRERRCTLAHELTHIRLGLLGVQSASGEERVRLATARWLLPDLEAVADALADSTTQDAALDLWVTDDILHTRLAHLTDSERNLMSRDTAA
ncbi:ImmA/IrrE family metallo-endopeptidase [Cutibacterium sp. WCA-380-WT-3A]|uniref:ImmA/IrrE family metallo-endopeptidase n=1 Tax=Cutibacterium porci TaxID=2605781 RepID=A0A7K0J5W0_9ACTN|nr:ImmA/IrrE family metallo-endopeptidase [Cutibacterium porci]MSS45325.1 ImmA/IrrE family metallo-endopeptidase [Cutibacterium porci]